MVTDFQKKKKGEAAGKIFLHLGGAALMLIAIALIVANIKMYEKRKEFLAQVAGLQHQIQQIKQKNSDLQTGISKSDDPAYIEKIAREELDLQKPGEQAVSFIMAQNAPPQSSGRQNSGTRGWLGWISNSWVWIKSKF